MENRKIDPKEDIALTRDVMLLEHFFRLNFFRRVGEMQGEKVDLSGAKSRVEQEVASKIGDMINDDGVLDLTDDHLERVQTAIRRTLRSCRSGELDDLSGQGDYFMRLVQNIKNNVSRLRRFWKQLKAKQTFMVDAKGGVKKPEPTSTVLRDDVCLIRRCVCIECYCRATREATELGINVAAANVEDELRELIDNNLDAAGNLQLHSFLDIMALLDATELALELLSKKSEANTRSVSCDAEEQAIGRIADQLLADLDAYNKAMAMLAKQGSSE